MADRPGWWRRLLAAVGREYERRIRAASLVTEYGASHGGHPHDKPDNGEAAEIMNLPRGARRPAFSSEETSSEQNNSPSG